MSIEISRMSRMEALAPSVPIDYEEAHWLAKARAGEEAAYRWFLERYRTRVVRLAAHILRRESEAEDVAQEAFLRAFRCLNGFRGQSGFYAWISQIVVRLCIDRQRRAFWRREVSVEESALAETVGLALDTEALTTQIVVTSLMAQLTPPMRAALVLRELDGLEYEEIAQILQIPVGTVRSRLNAARGQFRALWRQAMQEKDHE